jgi:hypothetical protein
MINCLSTGFELPTELRFAQSILTLTQYICLDIDLSYRGYYACNLAGEFLSFSDLCLSIQDLSCQLLWAYFSANEIGQKSWSVKFCVIFVYHSLSGVSYFQLLFSNTNFTCQNNEAKIGDCLWYVVKLCSWMHQQ